MHSFNQANHLHISPQERLSSFKIGGCAHYAAYLAYHHVSGRQETVLDDSCSSSAALII